MSIIEKPLSPEGTFELFVNGTLMRGLKLHPNLAGAEFVAAARTQPRYRLFSINDVHPGMHEVEEGGVAVNGEIYRLPQEVWQRVEAGEPPGLYCGLVHLDDGRSLPGILFHRASLTPQHRDISLYGDWRAYTASVAAANKAVVVRIYHELLSQEAYHLAPEVFAPDVIDHRTFPGRASGFENILEGARVNRIAFPDLAFTIDHLTAADDLVLAHWVMHGTHLGDYPGHPAMGRPVVWRGITQFRLAAGRVVERWLYADPIDFG